MEHKYKMVCGLSNGTIAASPMPLNDLECHFCCLKPFWHPYYVKHGTNLLTWRVARSLCRSSASCWFFWRARRSHQSKILYRPARKGMA